MVAVARRFPLCSRDELRRARTLTRWMDDLRDEVTVVEVNDEILAWSSICPHFGGQLEAKIEQGALRCGWHGWRFDLRTGVCLTYETSCRLRRYEIEEHDGMLEIVYGV